MTHARTLPEPLVAARQRSFDGVAEPSELMRQLSDLLVLAPLCRRRACRLAGRCRGGEGPHCFHENRAIFAAAMMGGLRDARRFWARHRALARAAHAGPRAREPALELRPERSGPP
jgi:hypothetical protein